jgi:hypothetical protein
MGKSVQTPQAGAIQCKAPVVTVNGRSINILPPEASAALPSRGQVAVTGTIEGHAWDTIVEPDGRRGHWLDLSDEITAATGLEPDDMASITLAPTKEWPEPEVPGDLQAALDEAPDLADMWQSITPMARWEWARWVCATKNPDTRARRVEVAISKMRSGKRRPCCFDLSSCTVPELAKSGKLIAPD